MATTNKTTQLKKEPRTSVGSGKTSGAVSLAYVDLRELLKIVRRDARIPIGRVFGESLGFKLRKPKNAPAELVLG